MNAPADLSLSDAALQAERSARSTRQAEVVAALRAVLPAHALLYRQEIGRASCRERV